MKNDKPCIAMPIVAEGKYDKAAIASLFDATVITTSGFGIFNSKEKQALLKRLGEKGIIILTDSDGGGRQIRSFLLSIIPEGRVYNAYIPKIKGKERRKTKPSREGLVGVEGVGREVLYQALSPFILPLGEAPERRLEMNAARLYLDGLSGGDGASARRDFIAKRLSLPTGMSAKAFAEALSLVLTEEEYSRALLALRAEYGE